MKIEHINKITKIWKQNYNAIFTLKEKLSGSLGGRTQAKAAVRKIWTFIKQKKTHDGVKPKLNKHKLNKTKTSQGGGQNWEAGYLNKDLTKTRNTGPGKHMD